MKNNTPTLAGQPGEIKLTDVELQLIMVFRGMDGEAQEFTMATAQSQARNWPAHRPSLRLVAGGAA